MLSKLLAAVCVTTALGAAKDKVMLYKTNLCPGGDTIYPAHCPEPQTTTKYCPTVPCPYSDDPRDLVTCMCKCDKAPDCKDDETRQPDCTCKKKYTSCADGETYSKAACECMKTCDKVLDCGANKVQDPSNCNSCSCLRSRDEVCEPGKERWDLEQCACVKDCKQSGWPAVDGKCPEETCSPRGKDLRCNDNEHIDWHKCECSDDKSTCHYANDLCPNKDSEYLDGGCGCVEEADKDKNCDPCNDPAQSGNRDANCKCMCEQEKEGIPFCENKGQYFDRTQCKCVDKGPFKTKEQCDKHGDDKGWREIKWDEALGTCVENM